MSAELEHVYWLGGSPCAGKSSIAHRLASQYGLTLYHCDSEFERQQQHVTAVTAPTIYQLNQMSCDELWLRPVAEQLRTAIQFYTEQFHMILAELCQKPTDAPILVEGAALLPTIIAPHLAMPQRAVWIIPTDQFQRRHYAQRPWIHGVLRQCSQPEQAFEKWMQRDAAFANWIQQETAVHNLPCLVVDGRRTILENSGLVAKFYGKI